MVAAICVHSQTVPLVSLQVDVHVLSAFCDIGDDVDDDDMMMTIQ